MPFLEMESKAGHKRKRPEFTSQKVSKAKRAASSEGEGVAKQISELESQILESRKHYNNIVKLLALAKNEDISIADRTLSSVALCRIFCRLFANDILKKYEGAPDSEIVIVKWLRERLGEYVDMLSDNIRDGSEDVQITALTLGIRLLKEEVNHEGFSRWEQGIFPHIIGALLQSGSNGEIVRQEFCQKTFLEHDDVQYATLGQIATKLKHETSDKVVLSSLSILSELGNPEGEEEDLDLLADSTARVASKKLTAKSRKKQTQAAWLQLLKCPLTKEQNKHILGILVHRVVPWFSKAELLMDYLTDSFNIGGATSLLALSGLFHLMSERNLDYPSFYQKLYSLLDDGILHSKHRSRFFRLLDLFMASTHLPSALVASFIKRLSRLALHAPPAGIVVVVPWIYNMFKQHPQCTFMIHRVLPSDANLEDHGFNDPFDMAETDPLETRAIESSIWEVETLRSHWHPNIATLAKIISEQFTKQAYALEDFLDHSYNSLLDAELGKETKRTPVVEYEIPKRIFTKEGGGLNDLGSLMKEVLDGTRA